MAQPKKEFKVGSDVTYVPNGVDYGSRPKNVPVPAKIINAFESEDKDGKVTVATQKFDGLRGKKQVSGERQLFNLVVFQDSEVTSVRKVRVPHKADALDGESYFE